MRCLISFYAGSEILVTATSPTSTAQIRPNVLAVHPASSTLVSPSWQRKIADQAISNTSERISLQTGPAGIPCSWRAQAESSPKRLGYITSLRSLGWEPYNSPHLFLLLSSSHEARYGWTAAPIPTRTLHESVYHDGPRRNFLPRNNITTFRLKI